MASLQVFVCLLGLVVLCHSQCFFQMLVVTDPHNPPKGCVDKYGTLHPFGSEWDNMRDCVVCSCSNAGMGCCSKTPSAVALPDECELVVNKETCTTKVVLKSDKTKECKPM